MLTTNPSQLTERAKLNGHTDQSSADAPAPTTALQPDIAPANDVPAPTKPARTPRKGSIASPNPLWLAKELHKGLPVNSVAYDLNDQVWRLYNSTHWQEIADDGLEVEAIISKVFTGLQIKHSKRLTLEVLWYARSYFAHRFPAPRPGLINFQNGTLDVFGGTTEPRPHDPANYFTYCLPYGYDNTPPPDFFVAWLIETMPDPVGREAVMGQIGLALLQNTTIEKAVLLFGPTRSGKTLMLKLANLAAGMSDGAFVNKALFDEDIEGMRSRATHKGQLIACYDELQPHALRHETIFKSMTSHVGVSMRQMHERELVENKWMPKLMMNTNDNPKFVDHSGALARRLLVIACPNTHENDEDLDTHLVEKLSVCIPQFAAACIAIALTIYQRGYFEVSEQMRIDLNTIVETGDPLKAFLADECIMGVGSWVATADLYEAFKKYVAINNPSSHPVGKNGMVSALCSMGAIKSNHHKVKGKDIRTVDGIGLLPRPDDD